MRLWNDHSGSGMRRKHNKELGHLDKRRHSMSPGITDAVSQVFFAFYSMIFFILNLQIKKGSFSPATVMLGLAEMWWKWCHCKSSSMLGLEFQKVNIKANRTWAFYQCVCLHSYQGPSIALLHIC